MFEWNKERYTTLDLEYKNFLRAERDIQDHQI